MQTIRVSRNIPEETSILWHLLPSGRVDFKFLQCCTHQTSVGDIRTERCFVVNKDYDWFRRGFQGGKECLNMQREICEMEGLRCCLWTSWLLMMVSNLKMEVGRGREVDNNQVFYIPVFLILSS